MGRIWLWVSVALVVLLCRQFSFWAVFGWAYAAATLGLVVVCFMYRRREKRKTGIGKSTVRQNVLSGESAG